MSHEFCAGTCSDRECAGSMTEGFVGGAFASAMGGGQRVIGWWRLEGQWCWSVGTGSGWCVSGGSGCTYLLADVEA